jgi:hypothetical protein
VRTLCSHPIKKYASIAKNPTLYQTIVLLNLNIVQYDVELMIKGFNHPFDVGSNAYIDRLSAPLVLYGDLILFFANLINDLFRLAAFFP